MRVEEDRDRLRPADRDRPWTCAQQALSKHKGVGKAGAGLMKLDKGAAVIEHFCNLVDVWRNQAGRCRGMADQVREIIHREAGFAERAPHGGRSEFGIAVSIAGGFQADRHVAS
jgi:hypothetical protein